MYVFTSYKKKKRLNSMATETLGAHLRNLLTPYKTLISVCEETRFEIPQSTLESILQNCKENFDIMIEFSNSDKMENVLWRGEGE